MNLRERLEIRATINLIISIIEKLVNIFGKLIPKNKINPKIPEVNPAPNRPKPLKRLIDTINNIPFPWRKSNNE